MVTKGVVMAGGQGTRLRPVTETLPKPFVRIAGRPCIDYVVDSLTRAGVEDVVVTTHYRPDQLIEHLGGGTRLGTRIFYSLEDEPLGTAGGVARARALLEDTFFVTSGDVLADVDLGALARFHEERGAVATMALTEVPWDAVSEFGVVDVADDGRIRRFQEKPRREDAFSNLVNAGIYLLEPEVLDLVPRDRPYDFSNDLFPRLLKEGAELYAHPLEGLWMDVGRPEDLIHASIVMGERRHGGSFREDATVHGDAEVLRTNLYRGSRVEASAFVEESILYDDAVVGEGARVRGSILCEGSVVEEGATVEDAVLGAGARVLAGTTFRGGAVQPGEVHGGA